MLNKNNSEIEILNKFLRFKRRSNKSENTINNYKSDLVHFFQFLLKRKDIQDKIDLNFIKKIKSDDIEKYFDYLEFDLGNSNTTRARKQASLESFYSFLRQKKYLEFNPMEEIAPIKISKRNPTYLTLDECKKFLQTIEHSNNNHKIRDEAIFRVFLTCGLRISELCNIKLKDIKDEILTVIGKGDKQRSVNLSQSCLNSINNYLKERKKILNKEKCKYLFISQKCTKISPRTVEVTMKKYIKETGLDETKYTPHKLRHTALTLMYQNGTDIRTLQEIAGHSNLNTTKIYTHVSDKQVVNAINSNPINSI